MEYIEEVRAELHPRSLAHGKRSLLIARTPSQVVGRSYDFFYLRCDYSNDCNVGCKWSLSLNLDRTSLARECSHDVGIRHRRLRQLCFHPRARLGTRWNKCGSDKLCVLSYANIQASVILPSSATHWEVLTAVFACRQGKPSLINHFKNSSVLDQDESRRPKLFITSGPHAGEPEPFPGEPAPTAACR